MYTAGPKNHEMGGIRGVPDRSGLEPAAKTGRLPKGRPCEPPGSREPHPHLQILGPHTSQLDKALFFLSRQPVPDKANLRGDISHRNESKSA